jgi:hypothetical protein
MKGGPETNLTRHVVFIGDLLIAHGPVTPADVAAALEGLRPNPKSGGRARAGHPYGLHE